VSGLLLLALPLAVFVFVVVLFVALPLMREQLLLLLKHPDHSASLIA
jgi:hypothetical protein